MSYVKNGTTTPVNPDTKANPANPTPKAMATRDRIPMSVPVQKLEVPEIPGYHLHWFMGNESRLQQAIRAGYSFVEEHEVDIVNTGLADDAGANGNTDLGTRVSIVAGSGTDNMGQSERLYLMKLPREYWESDKKVIEDRNEQIAQTLRGGVSESGDGAEHNYVPESSRKNVNNLFMRKRS